VSIREFKNSPVSIYGKKKSPGNFRRPGKKNVQRRL